MVGAEGVDDELLDEVEAGLLDGVDVLSELPDAVEAAVLG